MNFSSRFKIENELWQTIYRNRVESEYNQDLDEIRSEGLADDVMLKYKDEYSFRYSGDVEKYIRDSVDKGRLPIWAIVSRCFPKKDYRGYLENVKTFWDWFLESPETRLEEPYASQKRTIVDHFWGAFRALPFQAIEEPETNARLFLDIYGERFRSVGRFPISFGEDNWCPEKYVTPEDMFTSFLERVNRYLFSETNRIYYSAAVATLDYWFSTIDILIEEWIETSGILSLTHDVDGFLNHKLSHDERELFGYQDTLRKFLGNMHGYHVDYEYNERLIHNDIEVENYVRERWESYNWPPAYYKLLDFIHRHKEEAMNASEDD